MAKERPPLEEMTLRQLRKVASQYNISRYSRMRKAQLLDAIVKIERQQMRTMAPSPAPAAEVQEARSATKFELGSVETSHMDGTLASVDEGLSQLPQGYGESRIVMLPRDPQWSYAYWDISNEHKEALRRQGGQQLALRLYDVTEIDLERQSPHSVQEYPCDELAREWYLPMPVSDRDYLVEIGYRCADGRWLVLARSTPVHTPPVFPSDWIEDNFITVNWEEDLRGQTKFELSPPPQGAPIATSSDAHDEMFAMRELARAERVAGSLYGSMQPVHCGGVSSYVFPSGAGLWAVANGNRSNGTSAQLSRVGFSTAVSGTRPRQFWLVADAELIVYGATEPDATVTIGGQPIQLEADGTFRFQMSLQEGLLDYPIAAVAADGEQTRSVHLQFTRQTQIREE